MGRRKNTTGTQTEFPLDVSTTPSAGAVSRSDVGDSLDAEATAQILSTCSACGCSEKKALCTSCGTYVCMDCMALTAHVCPTCDAEIQTQQ